MNKNVTLSTDRNIIEILGVEVKFKQYVYPVLIQPLKVKELCQITELENSIRIGASVTLAEMETALRGQIKTQPGYYYFL